MVRAIIGKDGRVKSLEVVSGDKILAEPSMEAIQRWEYKPYIRNGEPVEVATTITTHFALDNAKPKIDKPEKTPEGYKKINTQMLEDLCVRPTLAYPAFAQQASVEGDVAVQLMLAPDGRIVLAKALSGPDMLRADAEHYVRTFRCMAARKRNGDAHGVDSIIVVNYRLSAIK